MIDLARELKKFARSEHKEFADFVNEDIECDFAFFGREFARLNDIDGHKIRSVIVNAAASDLNIGDNDESDRLMKSQIILYCPVNSFDGLRRDLIIHVNGDIFTVKEFHNVNNYVWRILLERND